jgi:hypothetical protein
MSDSGEELGYTATDVAEYMVQSLYGSRLLYQEIIASEIEEQFGDKFVYINRTGNRAIAQEVLDEFRRLTQDDVVWARQSRYWRYRSPADGPARAVIE